MPRPVGAGGGIVRTGITEGGARVNCHMKHGWTSRAVVQMLAVALALMSAQAKAFYSPARGRWLERGDSAEYRRETADSQSGPNVYINDMHGGMTAASVAELLPLSTLLMMGDRGRTKCDIDDGKPKILYHREYCGGVGDCVLRHETRHVRDLSSCCERLKACVDAATRRGDRWGQIRCVLIWNKYEADDWFECRAWRVTRSCVGSLLLGNCCSDNSPKKGSGITGKCCNELRGGLEDANREVLARCHGWWNGRFWDKPSCPFDSDGSIRKSAQ